ncbi:MAG: baseplate J/gp47 family protein [Pyrinomonadaceae bacterium]
MVNLIPAPDLDLRDEEAFAAEAISLVSDSLTTARIDRQIEILRQLRARVEAGELMPVTKELTNANTASPHTVLAEHFSWQLAQQARNINQLPVRDMIEFHRLFGIELREATQATTTLRFTTSGSFSHSVTIPSGTRVTTEDDAYIFETTVELVIVPHTATGDVAARRTVAGETYLLANTLTHLAAASSDITSVTNPAEVDSGSDAETVEEALQRARNYQRRAGRLVSAQDITDAIFEDVLHGNGIVKTFPFVKDGDWSQSFAGHTTVVVMTQQGAAVSDEIKLAIGTILQQAIGNQFIYVKNPTYVDFNVSASVRLNGLTAQQAVFTAIENNLRSFYAATAENFGRPILRGEIIAKIEQTSGVDRIVAQPSSDILAAPLVDVVIAPYEIPRLVTVTLNAA